MRQHSTSGFHYLSEGFKLIFKPGLKRFVIIPLLINSLLFVGLFIFARHFFSEFDLWIQGFLPSWLQWLGNLLWLIFLVGFILFFIFFFATIANLISAPFNSFLAEKIELSLTGNLIEEKSLLDMLKDTPRIIGRQLAIIGYYLPRALVLLIFFFVPIIQIIAPLLWFLFNAWFMTLQYLDYPTDNHRIPIRQIHIWLWDHRLLSFSFGGAALILNMIPFVNFFVLPAAVAGATKMWINENH